VRPVSRDCKLHDGQRGACFVRGRVGETMVLTTYGRSSGFCVDPIEKKPLNHFYPASSVLSFGTAGCNLACKFCQNWTSPNRAASTSSPTRPRRKPSRAAQKTRLQECGVHLQRPGDLREYAMDVRDACHARGIQTVASRRAICTTSRAAISTQDGRRNVDLKAFTDEFYVKQTGSHLQRCWTRSNILNMKPGFGSRSPRC